MGNYMVYLLCFLLAFVCLLILLLMNMELRTDQETIRTLKILGFTGAQIRLNYLRMHGKITAAGALFGGGGMAILLRNRLNRMYDGAGGFASPGFLCFFLHCLPSAWSSCCTPCCF